MPVINTNVVNTGDQVRQQTRQNAQGINQALQGLTNTFMDVAKFGEMKRQFDEEINERRRQFNKLQDLEIKKSIVENQYGGNWKQFTEDQPETMKSMLQGLVPDDQIDNIVNGIKNGNETLNQQLQRAFEGYSQGFIQREDGGQTPNQQQNVEGGQTTSTSTVNQTGALQGQGQGGVNVPGTSVTLGPMNGGNRPVINAVAPNQPPPPPGDVPVQGPQNMPQDIRNRQANDPMIGGLPADYNRKAYGITFPGPGDQNRTFDTEFVQNNQRTLTRPNEEFPAKKLITSKNVSDKEKFAQAFTTVDQRARNYMSNNPNASPVDIANNAFEFGERNIPIPTQGLLKEAKKGETYKDVYKRIHGEESWNRLNTYARELGLVDGEKLYWARQQVYANVDPKQQGGVNNVGTIAWEADYGIPGFFKGESKNVLDLNLTSEERANYARAALGNNARGKAVEKALKEETLSGKDQKVLNREINNMPNREDIRKGLYKAIDPKYNPYARLLNLFEERGVDAFGLGTGLLQEQAKIDQADKRIEQGNRELDIKENELALKEKELDAYREKLRIDLASQETQERQISQLLAVELMKTVYKELGPNQREALKAITPIVQDTVNKGLELYGNDPEKFNAWMNTTMQEGSIAGNSLKSFYEIFGGLTGLQPGTETGGDVLSPWISFLGITLGGGKAEKNETSKVPSIGGESFYDQLVNLALSAGTSGFGNMVTPPAPREETTTNSTQGSVTVERKGNVPPDNNGRNVQVENTVRTTNDLINKFFDE